MITLLLAALALILGGEAAVISVFALDGEPALAGWIIATLATLGLTAAALVHAVNPADMFTLSGVVLFAGIAGAGWSPEAKEYCSSWLLLRLWPACLPVLLVCPMCSPAEWQPWRTSPGCSPEHPASWPSLRLPEPLS